MRFKHHKLCHRNAKNAHQAKVTAYHHITCCRYGPVTLKDNAVTSLADNKYHSVWIRRPDRFEQVTVGAIYINLLVLEKVPSEGS